MIKNIAVISLGCDKNRVDTERMLYNLIKNGHRITNDYDTAQIIIINTCAFINSARQEAIDTILFYAGYKQKALEKLIVTGCLPQKYIKDIENELYEVDAFLGINSYDDICNIINNLYKNSRINAIEPCDKQNNADRIISTPPHYAFLKIAEGCDNRCTFCTIPSIRGNYRSRSMESLISEAKILVENGAKELILVAQDVTRYGIDIYGKIMLVELLKKLTELDLKLVRLMYCYPELVNEKLIELIDNNDKIAKYIDIPLQHVSNGILKLMNRRSQKENIELLIKKIRACKNYISIRTTFMVGFPSETDEQFDELLAFVKEYKIDNIGVFAYSTEDDTPSAKIKGRISDKIKRERVKKIGEQHLLNTIERNKSMVGKILDVVYEDIDYGRNMFRGRSEYNAPDIDTVVYFTADFVNVGDTYKIKITNIDGYDLIGEKLQ